MAWQTSDCVQRGRKIMDGVDSRSSPGKPACPHPADHLRPRRRRSGGARQSRRRFASMPLASKSVRRRRRSSGPAPRCERATRSAKSSLPARTWQPDRPSSSPSAKARAMATDCAGSVHFVRPSWARIERVISVRTTPGASSRILTPRPEAASWRHPANRMSAVLDT